MNRKRLLLASPLALAGELASERAFKISSAIRCEDQAEGTSVAKKRDIRFHGHALES